MHIATAAFRRRRVGKVGTPCILRTLGVLDNTEAALSAQPDDGLATLGTQPDCARVKLLSRCG